MEQFVETEFLPTESHQPENTPFSIKNMMMDSIADIGVDETDFKQDPSNGSLNRNLEQMKEQQMLFFTSSLKRSISTINIGEKSSCIGLLDIGEFGSIHTKERVSLVELMNGLKDNSPIKVFNDNQNKSITGSINTTLNEMDKTKIDALDKP